jgi:hypothetical protein
MHNNKLIIVSLTSWIKRIDTVSKTIDCLLSQTLLPDAIELNLSLIEFPHKENDFKPLFKTYIEKHKHILHLNFIEGNTKAFKKIIPTVKKYYGKDYYLLSVDDDCIYSRDYIKIMVEQLNLYNTDFLCMRKEGMAGSRMIYNSTCFTPDFWENFNVLPKEIIDKSVDDSYYLTYLRKKKKKLGNYFPNNFKEIFSFHDEIDSLHEKYRKEGYMESVNKAMSKIHIKQ